MMTSNIDPFQFSAEPFNYHTISSLSHPVYESTRIELRTKINQVHQQHLKVPSQTFFKQFSHGLTSLTSASFQKYCQLSMQVDSGDSVNAVTTKNVVAFYIPTVTTVEAVKGV